jgi:adenosylcobinamide amidohydrolase
VDVQVRLRREAGRDLGVLVVRFPVPVRVIASAPHGGGLGPRRWVVNAEVPPTYGRRDPDHHLAKLGVSLGLPGRGVGMLTAADVRRASRAEDDGVEVLATVGLGHPINAATPARNDPAGAGVGVPAAGGAGEMPAGITVGTINVLAVLPDRLSDAALVNAVATATEAKAQALRDLGFDATGTATDAVVIACPDEGRPQAFGGPRSVWGSRLARAVHAAVLAGGLT